MKKTLITFSLALSLFTLHSFACGGAKSDITKKSSYSSRAAVLNVGDSCAGKSCKKSAASCASKKGTCSTSKAECKVSGKKADAACSDGSCPVSKSKK